MVTSSSQKMRAIQFLLVGVLFVGATIAASFSDEDFSQVDSLGLPRSISPAQLDEFLREGPKIVKWIHSFGDSNPIHRARNAFECNTCRTAIGLAMSLLDGGSSAEEVATSIINLCVVLGVASAPVCRGAVERYVDPVSFIYLQRPYLTAQDMCAVVLQTADCGHANASYSDWTININPNKPPVEQVPLLPSDRPTVPVLHLTDVHMDLHYVEGSLATCDGFLCCRDAPTNVTDPEDLAGQFGGYLCDFPKAGVFNLFADAKARYPEYEFVMLTGDYVHHAVWATTPEDNMAHNTQVADYILTLFPSTKVYPVIGNHEAHPCNLFPPSAVWDQGHSLEWMYNNMADLFASQLPSDALETFRQGGYYTLLHKPGFRIVTLNNNRCYTNNFWLLYDFADPDGQLQWFADTMQAAEDAGEKVFILGHVPPGDDCWATWSAKLVQIINRYESIIQGQFYGHTHNDDVRVFYEDAAHPPPSPPPRPTSVMYIGASVTTYTDLNPGYKVFHVDGSSAVENPTWEIVDHETWVYNLTEANQNGVTQWYKLYSARELYGLENLRPEAYNQLIEAMVNDDALFQKYYTNWVKAADTAEPCDDMDCRFDILCTIVTTNVEDLSHCGRLRSLVQYPTQAP